MANPPATPEQVGIAERADGAIRYGFSRILGAHPAMDLAQAVRFACLGRNHTILMNTGFSPSAIVFGKSTLFGAIENGLLKPMAALSSFGQICRIIFWPLNALDAKWLLKIRISW